MKWLALLFLVVLAKDLNGHQNPEKNGEHQEKSCILKINRTLIVEEYVEAVETFPAPTVEHDDCGGEQFRDDYNQILARWGQEILDSFHNQGIAAAQNLIDDVETSYNKLVNSIGRSSKKDSGKNNADNDLKYLVNQLNTFLYLKPGNQTIEQNPLPELPKQPTKIVSRTEKRTASDFFLHLPESVNGDSSSVYGFITGIYLRGWYNSRKYLDIWQLQYRNQLLNNWVLPAYRKVVEEVFKNRDFIQSCVSRDTWSSFENYGNSIIKISNEWLQTLAELEQYKNSS